MARGDEDLQGGGQRGGPRRWTGTGPRPARHIPWPELFKHHQSVLQGHLKMMDMVRKHCMEGSGNYKAAEACVDRTHEMLRMFKQATATFAPPRDNIDRVPLGASSASMYPGYSPADHIYGEAAAEYGVMIAEAKRQGKQIERNPDGVEYVVGQSQLSLREQLEELRKSREAMAKKSTKATAKRTREEQTDDGEPMEGVEQSTEPEQLFIIDSNPMPLNALQNTSDTSSKAKNKANDKAKRRISFTEEQSNATANALEEGHKKKKIKTAEAESAQISKPKPLVEEYDISAEVDARHKEKEERRKRKEEKKRKRESGSSLTEAAALQAEEVKAEKPSKKKKKKKAKDGEDEKPQKKHKKESKKDNP